MDQWLCCVWCLWDRYLEHGVRDLLVCFVELVIGWMGLMVIVMGWDF